MNITTSKIIFFPWKKVFWISVFGYRAIVLYKEHIMHCIGGLVTHRIANYHFNFDDASPVLHVCFQRMKTNNKDDVDDADEGDDDNDIMMARTMKQLPSCWGLLLLSCTLTHLASWLAVSGPDYQDHLFLRKYWLNISFMNIENNLSGWSISRKLTGGVRIWLSGSSTDLYQRTHFLGGTRVLRILTFISFLKCKKIL